MLTTKEASLLAALEPRAIEEGIEIVTIEVVGSRKAPTIRVYIDTEQGIVFDDIAAAQAWINEILDEIDPFPGAYTLEVSSPGIDRPLRTCGHFEAAVGEQVYATCSEPVDGRSRFTGTLLGVAEDGGAIRLSVDGDEIVLPFSIIKRAHIKGVVEFK